MYKFFWLSAWLVFLCCGGALAQSYGLSFNSHDVVQEKRTSLDLSPADSICFEDDMTIEFDVNFMPNRDVYFGYLLRIINGNQNIDIICSQQQFRIVSGQQLTNIAFTIDTTMLYHKWSKFRLSIDRSDGLLQFALNDKPVGSYQLHLPGACYRFLWGANDDQRFNTRDIPPMRIRDIRLLRNKKETHHWVLADTSGVSSTDIVSGKKAAVKNPVWVKPRHQHWQLVASFQISGLAAAAFDNKNERLFITGSDSLVICDPRKERNAISVIPHSKTNLLVGHQAVYDTLTGRLYDIYIDQKRVMAFDTGRKAWPYLYKDTLLTEYWHANKFISPFDSALYIIGGYGQLKYRNLVQRYHPPTQQWEVVKTGGDPLPPRYLAALGTNATGDTAYIMGGYGSVSGDQMVNPGNYYDLYSFDVRRRRFNKRYTFKPLAQHYVFANSMVIPPGGDQYYALIFANGSFNTHLQLIQGSLNDSSMHPVGNTIPYSFYDIQSFADLFYAPHSNKLMAVTFFYSGEAEKTKTTQVKIWSIDFPPENAEAPVTAANNKGVSPWWLLALAPLALLFFIRKKRPPVAAPIEVGPVFAEQTPTPAPAIPTRSVIHLFGQFQVIDREGADSTKLFTPLLKELFLLILVYTIRNTRGISSEALNELLWHDKSVKDAKNNRSVNLAKLKPILEKVGVVINKDTGAWQVHHEADRVWVDYEVFVQLLQQTPATGKPYMQRMLQIVERGPFLQQTEYSWLDDIKSEISNQVLDRCLGYIQATPAADDPEFIIEICNTIFLFDRLNEDALTHKCKSLIGLKRHALANTTYVSFTREYREIYGEEFSRSFNEIIK